MFAYGGIFDAISMIMKKNIAQTAEVNGIAVWEFLHVFFFNCANFPPQLLKYDKLPLPKKKMITIYEILIKNIQKSNLSDKMEAWETLRSDGLQWSQGH